MSPPAPSYPEHVNLCALAGHPTSRGATESRVRRRRADGVAAAFGLVVLPISIAFSGRLARVPEFERACQEAVGVPSDRSDTDIGVTVGRGMVRAGSA